MTFPLHSIVVCSYRSSEDPLSPGYTLITQVTRADKQWRVISGGWNHTGSLYGIPSYDLCDYHNLQVFSPADFPNPELLL